MCRQGWGIFSDWLKLSHKHTPIKVVNYFIHLLTGTNPIFTIILNIFAYTFCRYTQLNDKHFYF